MDIVLTLRGPERGIHLLHVEPAVGKPRMARGAGRPRLLAVLLVARQATDPLVYAQPRAAVAGAHLHARLRRVALAAQRLPMIGTHPHRPRAFLHRRQRHRATATWARMRRSNSRLKWRARNGTSDS
jgi:hypothetical protein